jgi:hypothetical protein
LLGILGKGVQWRFMAEIAMNAESLHYPAGRMLYREGWGPGIGREGDFFASLRNDKKIRASLENTHVGAFVAASHRY